MSCAPSSGRRRQQEGRGALWGAAWEARGIAAPGRPLVFAFLV